MASSQPPIRIEGLAALRRALRNIDVGAVAEMQQVTRAGATIVAQEAGRLAPRGTRPLGNRRPQKRLAEAYVGTTSGAKGVVRNPLPHASLFEYRKSGTAAQMAGARPVLRAIDRKADDVVDLLTHGYDAIVRANGFH